MKKKMVEYEIDLAHPPALTVAQRAEIASLQAKPESEIDYSEIPPLGRRLLEECGTQSLLSAQQDLHNGSHRLGCAALAARAGPGLSVAHQCNPAPRDDCISAIDGVEVIW